MRCGRQSTEARELVTFNGRTFDLPLLETRYLLARANWWGAELPHQDLYPVARALWRGRAADCRLSTLEGALLGLDRGDDLPGALVPQVYFRYLRTRRSRRRCRGSSGTTAGTWWPSRASTRGPPRCSTARIPATIPSSGWARGAGSSGGRPTGARASTRRRSARACPSRSSRGWPGGSAGSGGGRGGSATRGPSGRRRWRAPSARPQAPDRPGEAPGAPRARLRRRAGPDAGRPRTAEAWDLAERGLVEALERRAHRLTQRLARAVARSDVGRPTRRRLTRPGAPAALLLVRERERHDVEQVRHDADARPHGVERRRWLDGMDPRA